MMPDAALSFLLPDDAATDRLGQWLAARLRPGDTLLLQGPIGAGKTHLARALIRARLGAMTEVPSPSFTLVQTYDDPAAEIWHADLYRLGHPDEVIELGLEAAFSTAICLVEWPDRLGSLAPAHAIHLHLTPEAEARRATITAPGHPALIAALRADWGQA